MSGPRLLVLDIESVPIQAFTWGIWQQNIDPMSQIIVKPRMICYGARWHGERKKFFASEYHDGRLSMLESLRDLMDDAHAIVGWNSARFDRPWVQGEMDHEGMWLPAPSADIDLMRVAKKNLRLPSYKLDYVAQHHYGLPGKVTHQGFRLWRDIAIGTPEEQDKAWRKMKRYQLGDIDVTDAVFGRMKPLVGNLPNPALYGKDGEPERCGCGADHESLQKRGFAYTKLSAYQRYQCQACGAWLQGGRRLRAVDMRVVAR